MKLTLSCEHGTRTVEIDEGREGVGSVQPLGPELRSYAAQFVAEVMPRCPYCEAAHVLEQVFQAMPPKEMR